MRRKERLGGSRIRLLWGALADLFSPTLRGVVKGRRRPQGDEADPGGRAKDGGPWESRTGFSHGLPSLCAAGPCGGAFAPFSAPALLKGASAKGGVMVLQMRQFPALKTDSPIAVGMAIAGCRCEPSSGERRPSDRWILDIWFV